MKNISLFIVIIICALGYQKDCLSYEVKKDHPRLVNAESSSAKQKVIDQRKPTQHVVVNVAKFVMMQNDVGL